MLGFKQFFKEEDIKNWLLGRKEKEQESLIPPPGETPESLLDTLNKAELSGNKTAIQKAKKAIESHGYKVKIQRSLVPKFRRAAK